MALTQWKEISKVLGDPVGLTGSLDISGSLLLNGAPIDTSIFKQTGSFYSTTNDIQITGSLNISGTFLVNGSPIDTSIFRQTGSYYSTTNDLKITGSLDLALDGTSDYFAISVSGSKKLEVNTEGTLILVSQSVDPTPQAGGIYYGSDNAFYLGFQT